RRVWCRVREVPERGAGGITAGDDLGHLPGLPVRDVKAFGQVPGPLDVRVVAHAVGVRLPRVPLGGEVAFVVVSHSPLSTPLLAEDDVHVTFKHTGIIDGLSLSVDDDEFVSIVGTSGCGKTTFLP